MVENCNFCSAKGFSRVHVNACLQVKGRCFMVSKTEPRLRTPGIVAAEIGVPLHRVLHLRSTRADIHPAARAGTLRLYDSHAVARVRRELLLIAARRRRGTGVSDAK